MVNGKWSIPIFYLLFSIFFYISSVKPTLSSICSQKLVLQSAKLGKLNSEKDKYIHFDSENWIKEKTLNVPYIPYFLFSSFLPSGFHLGINPVNQF